jgi:CBS domain-containing protein
MILEACSVSYSVDRYMRKDIATVDAEVSAVGASKIMLEKNVGYLVVLENAQPAGIVTERDLVLKVMAKAKDPSRVRVREVMSKPLVSIDPEATVEEAVRTMAKHGIRRLPVVRNNILYGIFTSRDLAKHFNEYEDRVTQDIIRHMSMFSLPF